jgi:isochorismate synthase
MLIYRFPNQEITKKNGGFVKIKTFPKNGFVIQKFKGSDAYIFEEDETQNSFTFLKNQHQLFTKNDYLQAGEKLVIALQNSEVKKTVLSRIHSQTFDTSKLLELFYLIEKEYPSAFVYCFSDPILGTWLGASPEILLTKEKDIFQTTALASTKNADDPSPWNKKEKKEQEFVRVFINENLQALGIDAIEQTEVYESFAGPVKHLRSDFHFTSSNSIEKILNCLHPTPAVCGLPQKSALKLIDELEQHKREFYAGYIGEINDEQTAIYVNLRCCQITENQIHLFLGGGYTLESNPLLEWEETENKSRTILDIIQKL